MCQKEELTKCLKIILKIIYEIFKVYNKYQNNLPKLLYIFNYPKKKKSKITIVLLMGRVPYRVLGVTKSDSKPYKVL